jgi:hypothetical protein
MVTTGKRFTPQEIARSIDAITVEDIQRCAKTYLWDKDFALAAVGQTEGLLDYSRLRFVHSNNAVSLDIPIAYYNSVTSLQCRHGIDDLLDERKRS